MSKEVFVENRYAENLVVHYMKPEENTPGFRVFRNQSDAISVQVRANTTKQVRSVPSPMNRIEARRVGKRLLEFAENGD